MQIDQSDGWDIISLDHLRLGTTLAESGDTNIYRRFCEKIAADFAGTTNPVVAERTIKISLLRQTDKKFLAGLKPFAATAANAFENADRNNSEAMFHAAWGSISLSLLDYRNGDYEKSAEWCRRCLAYSTDNQPRTATAHILLAMNEFQTGHTNEAGSELAQSRETIEEQFQNGLNSGDGEQGFWFDWIFASIILNEAEALMGQNAPTIQ
jgi:hypothetical protein